MPSVSPSRRNLARVCCALTPLPFSLGDRYCLKCTRHVGELGYQKRAVEAGLAWPGRDKRLQAWSSISSDTAGGPAELAARAFPPPLGCHGPRSTVPCPERPARTMQSRICTLNDQILSALGRAVLHAWPGHRVATVCHSTSLTFGLPRIGQTVRPFEQHSRLPPALRLDNAGCDGGRAPYRIRGSQAGTAVSHRLALTCATAGALQARE